MASNLGNRVDDGLRRGAGVVLGHRPAAGGCESAARLSAFDEGNLGFASSWLGLAGFALASGWAIVADGWLPHWQGWLPVTSAVRFVASRFVWTSQLWLVPYALFWVWFIAA